MNVSSPADGENSPLGAALALERNGLTPVPVYVPHGTDCSCRRATCSSPGKHPRGKWEELQQRRLTPGQLRSKFRGATNVGSVTGKISKAVVLDVDGPEGMESLKKFGFDPWEVPTPTVETGGGGWHFYYRYPEDGEGVATRAGILEKVDVRADGGFVVTPPSLHASGKRYEWASGCALSDLGFSPLPDRLLALLRGTRQESRRRPSASTSDRWGFITEAMSNPPELPLTAGNRNSEMTRIAGHLIAQDRNADEVRGVLLGMNADPSAVQSPIAIDEIESIVASISKRDERADLGKLNQRLRLWDPLVSVSRAGDRWTVRQESGKTFEVAASSAALLAFGKVRSAIFRETRQVIATPVKGSGGWERIAELFAAVAEVRDEEDQRHDSAEWLRTVCMRGGGWDRDMIEYDMSDPTEKWMCVNGIKEGHPVATADGRLIIRLSQEVRARAVARRAMPLTNTKEMGSRLREDWGFEDRKFDVQRAGKRVSIRGWESPPGFMELIGIDTVPATGEMVGSAEREVFEGQLRRRADQLLDWGRTNGKVMDADGAMALARKQAEDEEWDTTPRQ